MQLAGPTVRRVLPFVGLVVVLVSSIAATSASTVPYSISDIGPAPTSGGKISDIGAVPTPGYDPGNTPDAPAAGFTISDISPR